MSKLPGRWVLRGSLSQWCQGGSANCVEVQQCYKTLSALQHQLHSVVSRCRSQTQKYNCILHTHGENNFTTCFSISVALWWMREAAPLISGRGELTFLDAKMVSVHVIFVVSQLFLRNRSWTISPCLDRAQLLQLQWVGWCSSSSCWPCWSSTWGGRRRWRGRRQWGESCKNMRWGLGITGALSHV